MCVRPPLPRRAARTNRSDPRPRARPPPASRPAAPSCPRRVPWSPNLDRCPPSGIFVVDCAAHRGSQRGRPGSRWPGPHPDRRRAGQVHDGRLLQPPAAQPDALGRRPPAHRGVPGPARVRGVRLAAQRPRRRHAQALQTFLAANPHVEGVWNWTQDGGPLRAGPMTLYLRTGFWQLYDLNTYGTARLAWDPAADPAQITADWVRQTFSADPATVGGDRRDAGAVARGDHHRSVHRPVRRAVASRRSASNRRR